MAAGRTLDIGARPHGRQYARWAGWAGLLAGVLGAASGVGLLLVDPAVPDDRFSYPLSAGAFTVAQGWFFVHHFGLLAPQVALLHLGLLGPSRTARWGQWLALIGMAGLTFTELLAIAAAESPYPSARTDVLDGLYGITSIAIGLGLAAAGFKAVRARVPHRHAAWASLAIGVYVFVPMTPAIIAGFTAARLGIGGWMLLYALLGWALIRTPDNADR